MGAETSIFMGTDTIDTSGETEVSAEAKPKTGPNGEPLIDSGRGYMIVGPIDHSKELEERRKYFPNFDPRYPSPDKHPKRQRALNDGEDGVRAPWAKPGYVAPRDYGAASSQSSSQRRT